MKTALWGGLFGVAVLWPSRLAGPLDGAPLDTAIEAVLLGLVLAALVSIQAKILAQSVVRGLILTLLVWKAATAASLAQDGWCLRFTSPVPLYRDMGQVPHSWDIRADWRSPEPRCSAVMTTGYASIERFPLWFYNLPPVAIGQPAEDTDRPPHVTLRLDVEGFLHVNEAGILRVIAGPDVTTRLRIDGQNEDAAAGVTLQPGLHQVSVEGHLVGSRWSLLPEWNGADLWRASVATMSAPSSLDLWVRPWGRFVPAILIVLLLSTLLIAIARRARSAVALGVTATLSALMAASTVTGHNTAVRTAPLLLLAVTAIRMPRRLQNLFGMSLLVGIPFLALIIAVGVPQAGLFTWYTSGDDWWVFQRFAYRIVMQGYWLEGGQPTFWFQPLYRWIAGGLHMVFGDSSVGELFWDAACVLMGACFAFHVTRTMAGFRWAIASSVVTIAMMTLGPAWYLFGRGLSEITSAGLIYAAALWALRGRHGSWPAILAAGVFATLAFYTRLNNLPMVVAIAAFALPVRQPIGDVFRPGLWWPRVSKSVLAGVLGTIALGLWLFTARTWYYTGIPSMLYGTQAGTLSVWQATAEGLTAAQNLAGSVMMVLTMNDPPRFDLRALPLIAGVLAALLGLLRVRPFSRLPLNAVGLCLAGVSGALVARSSAYPGRFSVHLIPVAVALAACAISLLLGRQRRPLVRSKAR
ncbi:MAG: hypothetical protein Q7R30_02315 [Acidobacteriota bacterium]|nr:hypothetical protein [Acidobacteriota bacterium]